LTIGFAPIEIVVIVYKPLFELEEINTSCRIQLTKTLNRHHKVRTVGGPGEATEDSCRGLAFFLAFDPWSATLRCPPGSARFFDIAEKHGHLSPAESAQLSKTLISHGAKMARVYNGAFSTFFSAPRVRTIFSNIDDLDHLAQSGLAVGGSWVDLLFETCPFPLQPSRVLEVQSFRPITIEGEIDFYSRTPWLAWCEALDLICLGPWGGLHPTTAINMVAALEQRVVRLASDVIDLEDAVLGRKVILPMFSRGLQGVVIGLFTDVPKGEIEPILTTLIQFGETLSDVYADLRWKHFIDVLEDELNEKELAREVINAVSPVGKLIVSHEGRRAGYKLGYESDYWSGYELLAQNELSAERSKHGFTVAGPNGAEIYIEPITDIPHINSEFTRIRLENYLNEVFGSIATVSNGEALSLKDVQQLLAEYQPYSDDRSASLAKLRQFYVIAQVERHWHDGAVKVTNNELKRFLESLGRDAKNGYQVTSFASEFEKIFTDRVTATKTRNALSLSWDKGS
jgi:hypothetical protein